MERFEKFTHGLNPDEYDVLEIGALNRPIFKSGKRLRFADYLSTSKLIEKYSRYRDFDISGIVRVDYVVDGDDYRAAIDERFDLILASHVIEHTPNMLNWLFNVSEILKPDGILSLIIPDKRMTFDALRNETTGADLVGYMFEGHKKPDIRRVIDHLAHQISTIPVHTCEPNVKQTRMTRVHSPHQTLDLARQISKSGEYFDVHCNVFTAQGFIDAIDFLCQVWWPRLLLHSFYETVPGEIDFFVSFKRISDDTDINLIATENRARIDNIKEGWMKYARREEINNDKR